jgi:hypothetical protein
VQDYLDELWAEKAAAEFSKNKNKKLYSLEEVKRALAVDWTSEFQAPMLKQITPNLEIRAPMSEQIVRNSEFRESTSE